MVICLESIFDWTELILRLGFFSCQNAPGRFCQLPKSSYPTPGLIWGVLSAAKMRPGRFCQLFKLFFGPSVKGVYLAGGVALFAPQTPFTCMPPSPHPQKQPLYHIPMTAQDLLF